MRGFWVTLVLSFLFQAEDGIRHGHVTGVQTCALPILWAWDLLRLPRPAFQMRRSSSCAGRGSRSKSHAHTPRARASQRTMAKRNRGSIQPGPSHTRPTSRIKKKRGPKLKASRVRVPGSGDTRAEAIGGTSRAGSRRSGTRVLLVGHFDRSQYFGDDLVGGDSFQVRLRFEEQPVAQHRGCGGLDVVRNDEVAPVHGCGGLGHKQETDGGARARPKTQRGPIAGAPRDGSYVAE